MILGCCYYPEHWPEDNWADDARQMVEMGLSNVRIGEFAWSRIEPQPGQYDWAWLDRALDTLATAGLTITLCTPTATPPKWLVDLMPDMIAVDADGQPRRFGSRRHYCFSHPGYRAECARITKAMAARYGHHPAITAWQTDNEYGCHDTILSYGASAASAFRKWCADKYEGDISALNTAWGNVFWSMEYRNFAEIDPPNLTVTEPNPSHVLDYRRFASDETVAFNRIQADILRAASPGRDIVHNYMGFFTQFDHHALGKDLDVASWDSYPLGFLEQFWFSDAIKRHYARQGHPDIAAFHHDLYRGCAKGRWSVMEQQPGPVNWARFNPAPLPGMVRLWTLEAMAHGAEMLSYFRWRQVPFAQEQMHAGLLRPDGAKAQGAIEARQSADDILRLNAAAHRSISGVASAVALVFSYEAAWLFEAQPQGQSFIYLELVFEAYTALRKLGLNVDIVAPAADLSGYQMVVIPSLPIMPADYIAKLSALDCPVYIGPRSGSKTADFHIPANLAPGPLQQILPLKVTKVESLRRDLSEQGADFTVHHWLETVETKLTPTHRLNDGRGIVFAHQNLHYCAAWPDAQLLQKLFSQMAQNTALPIVNLPKGLRLRQNGQHIFAMNYSAQPIDLNTVFEHSATFDFILGGTDLGAASVAVWTAS